MLKREKEEAEKILEIVEGKGVTLYGEGVSGVERDACSSIFGKFKVETPIFV